MVKPKKNIEDLYRMRDNLSESRYSKIRLDRNERTLEFNRDILNQIKEKITDEMLMIYPEPLPLYKKMAEFEKVKISNLLFNSGSDQSIKSIFETYIEDGDEIVLHEPSYAMYSVYAKMFGATVKSINFEKDFSLDFDKMISQITLKTKMVVIENPNGFLGVEQTEENLLKLIKECEKKNILAVVDEAYFHFINTTMSKYINSFQNLIVVRTFSKAIGLASARVGYIISNETNISNLSKVKPMHELSQFAINSSIVLLDNFDLVEKNIKETLKSLEFLKTELNRLGLEYSNSVSNFLVAKLEIKNEEEFMSELKENSILIRRNFSQEFLKDYRRIGVSDLENMQNFINILENNR
ncbi:PLP-dependent enzyme, histidinol-phosphate/aromatic aminotransferase or cobyric acid decarboxylase [Thiovulum sp. ES]|nr:PLP-dependent enzyme, histidinol-phosphate/aromatic aminotransferase or cobyric acid decarboxylase [Thiovulum sp. ES]